jgi:hypothetical protein
MPWLKLMHLGDLTLTLSAAAAVTAWLLAARAWRSAIWWSVLYALAIGLVGASKIAFLGWGAGVPALGFKAISGHATGAAAVFPIVFYLLAHNFGTYARHTAVAAGLGLGAAVAVMLVLGGQHSASEAAAGWATGALVSLGSVRFARHIPASPPVRGLACATLAFALAAWFMQLVPVNYWMVKAALALSGSDRLHPWDSCG